MPIIAPTAATAASPNGAPAVAATKSHVISVWSSNVPAPGIQNAVSLAPFNLNTLQFGSTYSPVGCWSNLQPAITFWNGVYYVFFADVRDNGSYWYIVTDLVSHTVGLQIVPPTNATGANVPPTLVADNDQLVLAYATQSGNLAYYTANRTWLTNGTPGVALNGNVTSIWGTEPEVASMTGVQGTVGLATAVGASGGIWVATWLSACNIQYAAGSGSPASSIAWKAAEPLICGGYTPSTASAPALATFHNTIWAFWADKSKGQVLASAYTPGQGWAAPSPVAPGVSGGAVVSAASGTDGIILGYNDPATGVGFVRVIL